MKRSKWIKGENKPRPTDNWNKPSKGRLIDSQETPDVASERRRIAQEIQQRVIDRMRLNQTLNHRSERERHINSLGNDFDF